MDIREAVQVAICSLEGKTVFPKQADDAAIVLRSIVIQMESLKPFRSSDSRNIEEKAYHLLKSKLEKLQPSAQPDLNELLSSQGAVVSNKMILAGQAFEKRLIAAGMDADAVHAEIIEAMTSGGFGKLQASLERISQKITAHEEAAQDDTGGP